MAGTQRSQVAALGLMVMLGASILFLVIRNPDIPPEGVISTALGVGAGAALWRYGRTAPPPIQIGTVLLVALVTGLGQPEPWVTHELSFSFFLAPVVALMLTRAMWIPVASAVQLLCFLVRADWQGVYTDPTNLILILMVNVALIASRSAHDLALDAERQRSEERERIDRLYRLITENMVEALLLVGPDRKLHHANPAAQRLLGLNAAALAGCESFAFAEPEDRARVIEATTRAAAGESAQVTTRARCADGSFRWIEGTMTPFMRDGEAWILVIARDVDGQRRLQQRLEEGQRLESVGRLAGGIAHDFNNILTSILAAVHFAREAVPKGAPVAADLDDIQSSAERASGLTRQLLAFARRQILAPRPVDIDEVVRSVEGMLRRVLGEHVALETHGCRSDAVVRADPTQVEQIVLNLVINARDAMPNGGTIALETGVTLLGPDNAAGLPPGSYGVLTVRDDGQGMAPEVLARAFEPFFTTKAPGTGTGLGLATSYGIAQQHGGALQLESALGVGTTARVYLPLTAAPVPRAGAPTQRARPPRGHGRVLVVEDDAFVRRFAARLLGEAGFEVDEAADGAAALALAREGAPYDLLLTDVVMPRMGGPTLAGHLLEEGRARRVVFMSGFADDPAVRSGSLTARGTLLRKPFSAEALFEAVRPDTDDGGGGLQLPS